MGSKSPFQRSSRFSLVNGQLGLAVAAAAVGLFALAGCAGDTVSTQAACTDGQDSHADSTQDISSTGNDSDASGGDTANGSPTVVFVLPTEGEFALLGTVLPTVVQVDDDQGAAQVSVKITLKGSGAVLYQGVPNSTGLVSTALAALPAGAQTLVATGTDSKGASATAERHVYINTAPGAPVVSIAPTAPTALDTLTATVVTPAVDVDRKPSDLKYSFAWRRNDQATTQAAATVPPGVAKRGEVWQVIVAATDSYVFGPIATASVTVDDAAPSTPTVALTAAVVDLHDEVTCLLAVPATDADGDALTYQYQWWLDGAAVDAGTTPHIVIANLQTGGVAIQAGATLQCTIVASDGSKSSGPGSSPAVVVQAYDVCASALNPCAPQATCIGTETLAVVCVCKPGYQGDGKACSDINECLVSNGGCGDATFFACTNQVGGPASCADIDECTVQPNGACGSVTFITCQNVVGGPAVCTDINECTTNNGGCGAISVATCNNNYAKAPSCGSVGSCASANGGCGDPIYWTCKDNAGAAPTCTDINECATNNGGCGDPAFYSCTNKIGAPSSCADINECLTANGGCGNGNCANQIGATPVCTCTVAKGPAAVDLGTAGDFVVLAKSAISTVPTSAITGNVGLSPAAASYITGFALVADASNVFSASSQVVGKVYAANYAVPTPGNMTNAITQMMAAYTDAANRGPADFVGLGAGDIGGKTLAPGIYKWTSALQIPTDVVLDGCTNDVWIFQVTGDLSVAAGKKVTLTGGAQAKNVYWQVAGIVTIGVGAHFEGTILGKQSITLQTSATMHGRALAQTMVVLNKATIGNQ